MRPPKDSISACSLSPPAASVPTRDLQVEGAITSQCCANSQQHGSEDVHALEWGRFAHENLLKGPCRLARILEPSFFASKTLCGCLWEMGAVDMYRGYIQQGDSL